MKDWKKTESISERAEREKKAAKETVEENLRRKKIRKPANILQNIRQNTDNDNNNIRVSCVSRKILGRKAFKEHLNR